jgi:polyisoprenoid-binding protein YceI
MKTTYTILFFLLLAARVGSAEAGLYEIHPGDQARMELTVEKTGFLSGKKHLFTFSRYEGRLLFDRERPEVSTITLSIEAGSVSCHDTWLSMKDLRKVQEYALKDMLAVDRYPQIIFRSVAIKRIDSNQYEVQGTLTIRDITKPAVAMVSLRAGSNGDLPVEGESRLRLTDFGLKPPTAALGTIGTKNEMSFHFVLTATPRR